MFVVLRRLHDHDFRREQQSRMVFVRTFDLLESLQRAEQRNVNTLFTLLGRHRTTRHGEKLRLQKRLNASIALGFTM